MAVTPNSFTSEYDYAHARVREIEEVHMGDYEMTDALVVEYRRLKLTIAQIEHDWAVEDARDALNDQWDETSPCRR